MDVGPLNWTRYAPGQKQGQYESFYQRGNHPTRPLAFWIRYTLFSPTGQPEKAIGELWAIFFNGETGSTSRPRRNTRSPHAGSSASRFGAQVGDAVLEPGTLTGTCTKGAHTIGWDLTYRSDQEPTLSSSASLYEGSLPARRASSASRWRSTTAR